MSQFRLFGIGLVALLVFWKLMPAPTPTIITEAPGLSSSFTSLGAQPALAAVAATIPAAQSGLSVLGQPTITVDQIAAVLAQYNSPAKDYAQDIYDLGVKYGIDPAFCLAFFIHESSAGTNPAWVGHKPDGTTTHNLGNIVCTEGWRCFGRFRDYDSWHDGIEDWYKLIRELYIDTWGRTTVEAIIPKYAPASDNNDEDAYILSVNNMIQNWRDN
jgi:hypothetical protein